MKTLMMQQKLVFYHQYYLLTKVKSPIDYLTITTISHEKNIKEIKRIKEGNYMKPNKKIRPSEEKKKIKDKEKVIENIETNENIEDTAKVNLLSTILPKII